MTATLPDGVTPGSATGTGWTCYHRRADRDLYLSRFARHRRGNDPAPGVVAGHRRNGLLHQNDIVGDLGDRLLRRRGPGDRLRRRNGHRCTTVVDVGHALGQCPSAAAGIGTVPLDNNGALPTETQQSQVSGTTSGSSNDTTNNQVVDLAIGDLAAKNIAAKNIAAKNIAVKNPVDLDNIATEVAIPGQDPLADISLSNINVTYPDGCDPTAALGATNACTGWGGSWPARSTPPRPVSSSGLSRP